MNRQAHNAFYNSSRLDDEIVHCNTLGYGELSQYDPLCVYCWLGHTHTWKQHDHSLNVHSAPQQQGEEK